VAIFSSGLESDADGEAGNNWYRPVQAMLINRHLRLLMAIANLPSYCHPHVLSKDCQSRGAFVRSIDLDQIAADGRTLIQTTWE
jgi:hypothetical protein